MTAIFDPLLVPAARPRPAAGPGRSQRHSGPGRSGRSAGPDRRAYDGRRGFVSAPTSRGVGAPQPGRSNVRAGHAPVISITTTRTRPARPASRTQPVTSPGAVPQARPIRSGAALLVALLAFLLSFGAVTAVVESSAGASNTSVPADAPDYIVAKPGDTIWAIARRIIPEGNINGLVAELVRLNGATINAGQQVRIP